MRDRENLAGSAPRYPLFANHLIQKKESISRLLGICDSGGIRTHDPQLRRLLLYPAELRNHPLAKRNKLCEAVFVTFCGAKVMKIYRTTKFLSPIIEILPVSGVVHRKKENPQVLLYSDYKFHLEVNAEAEG